MKKSLIFTIAAATTFIFASCGDAETDVDNTTVTTEVQDDYYNFEGFSLKDYGIDAWILLPDETADIGAATEPQVIHDDGDFKWYLKLGRNFHMRIDDWADEKDMIAVKKDELASQNFYDVEYIESTPTFLHYKKTLKVAGTKNASDDVGVEHESYHCYGQVEIDGITYVFRSRDEGHEKFFIEYMAKSIKSVKPLDENMIQ